MILLLVEIPHADLAEVSRMVLVEIGAVVVGTTSHTTTTGMLAVLADSAVTRRDVAAAAIKSVSATDANESSHVKLTVSASWSAWWAL